MLAITLFFYFQLNQASTAFHSLSSAIVRFSFFHSISYLSCNRYVFVVVLLVAFPKQIGNLMISRYWVCFSLFCLPLQQHSSDRSISSSSSKRIKCESTKNIIAFKHYSKGYRTECGRTRNSKHQD